MTDAGKRRSFAAAALLLGAATALALAEGLLRLSGERPWHYAGIDRRIPATNTPDSELGWRSKPGVYDVPPFSPRGQTTRVTVLPDGARASGAMRPPAGETLLLIGDSFTFGWAVADSDTFAWRLQERLPGVDVLNHGVSGYGTYQSLLELESLLAAGLTPKRVLYGYLEGHEYRNVAHPLWTLSLTKYSTHGMVEVPYALRDGGGRLRRLPPTRWPDWPLKRHSALVTFLERRWVQLTQHERSDAAIPVTELILAEMARLCRERGIEFALVYLHTAAAKKGIYTPVVEANGGRAIDCSLPLTAEHKVPGDGHPNPLLHGKWADCIASALR